MVAKDNTITGLQPSNGIGDRQPDGILRLLHQLAGRCVYRDVAAIASFNAC